MMRDIARVVARNKLLTQTQEQLDAGTASRDAMYSAGRAGVYRPSCRWKGDILYVVGRDSEKRRLLACSAKDFRSPFRGKPTRVEGLFALEIDMTFENATKMQELFSFLIPTRGKGYGVSFGFGDRLGITTPAHLRLAKKYNLFPVVAQQSVRELDATGRSYEQVVADAVFGVFQEGYTDGFGADADHLRTMAEVRQFAKAGPSMVTIDISDYLRPDVEELDNRKLQDAFRSLPKKEQQRVRRTYSGKNFNLGAASVRFRPGDAEKAAVKFLKGIGFAEKAYKAVRKRVPECAIEFTVDEIPVVSTSADHYFIANEFSLRDIPLYSVALRFPGAMHKGVDFDGDTRAFDTHFTEQAAIANALGDHKVSVHSGSDKFAIYPIIARRADGRFHLKTSGTSWLVAMRTIAQVKPDLYREVHGLAMEVFPKALAKYEVTADINEVPAVDSLRDRELLDLFSNPNWRQLLHISYGGILGDESMKAKIFACLHENEEAYNANIAAHLGAHLEELRVERRS